MADEKEEGNKSDRTPTGINQIQVNVSHQAKDKM